MARIRFSLRDLFLGVLVCAALAAWAHELREKQRPLKPTHIAEYFASGLQKDVIAARAATGEIGEAWFAPALTSCHDLTGIFKKEHCLNREWFCDVRLPWDKANQFHDDLVRRIGSHIRHGQAGEHISTSEFEAETRIDSSYFLGVSTKYHCGDVHGTIRVYLTRTSDQQAQFIAVLNEHRVP